MKMETGCFKLPVFDQDTHTYQTSWQDLMAMARGPGDDKMRVGKRWEKMLK